MNARLLYLALAVLLTLPSCPACAQATLNLTATVTAPTHDQQFNGTINQVITINFHSVHTEYVSGGAADTYYTWYRSCSLSDASGASGNAGETTNGAGLSPAWTDNLDGNKDFTVYDGIRHYSTTASTSAFNVSPAGVTISPSTATDTVYWTTYGEG